MENVPKETETIAHKRNLRIAEKLKSAKDSFSLKKAWWTGAPTEIFGIFIIILLDFILVYPFFGKPSPFTTFSGPVVPFLAKGITLFGIPFSYALQVVNIVFFLAFPVTFYFFVRAVSGRKFSAFLAVLMANLPFAIFAKIRIENGIAGVDSANIASLSLLPLALFYLLKFLKYGEIKNLTMASVIAAVTALTSPFGFFVYLVMSLITTFSEFLLGTGRLKLLRLISVYLFTGSFCSFWYNPLFFYWMVTGPMGEGLRTTLSKLLPVSFFAIPILVALGYVIFDRKPGLQPLFLALFYSVTFSIIALAGGDFAISERSRYFPILGICISFLFGIAIVKLMEALAKKFEIVFYKYGLKNLLLIAISILMVISIYSYKWTVFPVENKVLGIWTDVQKGSIWVMNDVFTIKYSLVGDAITLIGICVLGYLYINYKKTKKTARNNI